MKENGEKFSSHVRCRPASKIIGETVANHQGENVGQDPRIGDRRRKEPRRLRGAPHGASWGMGNKLFAMPWEAFEFSATEHKLILNVDKEKLRRLRV